MSEISQQDRERMDNLITELRRYNDNSFGDVVVSCIEAARLLKKTPPTISRMLKEGRLHKVTIGNSSGIALKEIREVQLIWK